MSCKKILWLAPLLGLPILSAGCKTSRPQYTDVALMDAPAATNPPTAPPAAMQSSNRPALQTVMLSNRVDHLMLEPNANAFTLGPGDKVEIEMMGEPTSKVTTIVGPDGKLYFSLAPGVDVWGLTLAQAKAKLESEMQKYVREKPRVSLVLRAVESKRVWILGRVHAPGVYPMTAPTTLLEAISLAGGTMTLSNYRDQEAAGISEELADLKRSFVIRQGHLLPVDFRRLLMQGDMSQNIYLEPDDFVYLPASRSREVYVLGAVLEPRPVPYTDGMTVAGAVASAYGTIKGAYMHHVAVVRGSLAQPQVAIVDYKNVLRGEAMDLPLEPGDIVYVPFSPYRYLTKYVELVLNTFVSAAAINAGSAAIPQRENGAAGIFIPVGSGVQIIPPVSPPPIR